MEEPLRKQLSNIALRKREGEITKEEYLSEIQELIHSILEENPQRLLDLCKGHISGLPDEYLLKKAKEDTADFVFMNISCGSYHYETIVREPSHPDSRNIKKIFREILSFLGLEKDEISNILDRTKHHDDYNSAPAEVILDILIEDENIVAAIDWKFELENVEYNLNLIAKRLNLKPIKEYPPYEDGQPLGLEALELIVSETEYGVVGVWDGDTLLVFLTTKEKAPELAKLVGQLDDLWPFDEAFYLV